MPIKKNAIALRRPGGKPQTRDALMRRIQSSDMQARRAREKVTKMTQTALLTGTSAAAAFGTSFISASLGGPLGHKIGPVQTELVVGGAALTLALTGLGGNASPYLLAGAQGALDAYAANQGRNAGLLRKAMTEDPQ